VSEYDAEPGNHQTGEGVATMIEVIRPLPKVLLHDHLDGGLRPATVADLAEQIGHQLPTTEVADLERWFVTAATSGSLESYLETFSHTVAVMQTAEALRRVAREAVEDLAADGVVLAELRYAPELHQSAGLGLDDVVQAVQSGLDEGAAAVRAGGGTMVVGQILCAMRQNDRFEDVAALALRHRDTGVVGFDLAGPEAGFPPSRAAAAFAMLREADLPCTVHAGEAAGPESLTEAVHLAGACRLGHGVQLSAQVGSPTSTLAHWVRDRRIALEVCPTSNLQTGAATSIAEHPIIGLHRAGFAVTVNTDNRLQSGTSLSREFALLVDQAGWDLNDVREATLTAARAAFRHHDEREALVETVIGPGHVGTTGGRHRA